MLDQRTGPVDAAALALLDTQALAALLDGCAAARVGRRALVVHVPSLPVALTRPHHLRLIVAAMDPLLGLDRARLFRLADGTLVLVWRQPASPSSGVQDGGEFPVFAGDRAAAALDGLHRLFAGLPDPAALAALHELPRENAQVAACIARSRGEAASAPPATAVPLDPDSVAELESVLARADVAAFSRRRPVWAWPEGADPRVAWERRSLAVEALIGTLAPAPNPAGARPQVDPWLFRRLTRTLDRRLLALLGDAEELRQTGPFALNLNVATILAPDFLRFDAALPAALRGEVILGLLPADILSDAASYEFARDFARARGYRLLLRHVTPALVSVFPAGLLGVDLIQLGGWTDGPATLPGALDPAAVVLSGVHDAAMLHQGQRAGIGLFQGDYLQGR